MTIDPAILETLATGAAVSAVNFALVAGLAAVGGTLTERAGVLNLTHEGVLLLGAASAAVVAFDTGSVWLGAAAGTVAGLLLGVIKATWSVLVRTEQVVNGILLVPVGAGLANLLYKSHLGDLAAVRLPAAAPLPIPLLGEIPILGPALFRRSPLVYAAVLLVAAVHHLLYRTRMGLIIRTAGESPETLHFNGISVARSRFAAVLMGTAIVGFAGALLAIDQLHLFHPGMTAGRGWIAIAVVIVARWRPWPCILVALLFGATDVTQYQLQIESAPVPYEILLSLPYLATVGLLALRRHAAAPPAHLGTPFPG